MWYLNDEKMKMNAEDSVKSLYSELMGFNPEICIPVQASGSCRQYFRLGRSGHTLIGAFHQDVRENSAFLSFSKSFRREGLPVPEVLAESSWGMCYLLQDLGDTTLYGLLQEKRGKDKFFPEEMIPVYKMILEWLPRFQGSSAPDYSQCYPRASFDRQSMLWDLNYFKYYYLKLAGISFDEQALEDDFESFTSFLLEAPANYFMYRDFQSRNIMLVEGQPWFIDYQGGRRGALQYDVASLLYDAKADLPETLRVELLESYLDSLSKLMPVRREEYLRYFPGFALIRIFQAMGAYGFRGYYEKKPHFLQSIPYALNNLKILSKENLLNAFPELQQVIRKMISPSPLATTLQPEISPLGEKMLRVMIYSFSYKHGLPRDPSPNGGGFVFDCRSLPNPGREDAYKPLNGKDQPVIDFLRQSDQVQHFLKNVFSLIDQSVENYQERHFTNLMVSFGCTGGQHRSVYCAEALAGYLKNRQGLRIDVNHTEITEKP